MQFLIPISLILIIAILHKVTKRDYAKDYEDYLCRRMACGYRDIQRRITYAPTLTELYGIEDDIIDLWERYKNTQGVRDRCGELQAQLENKRTALRRKKFSIT